LILKKSNNVKKHLEVSSVDKKKLAAEMGKIRQKKIRKSEEELYVISPIKPIYDDIYYAGIEWLNKL